MNSEMKRQELSQRREDKTLFISTKKKKLELFKEKWSEETGREEEADWTRKFSWQGMDELGVCSKLSESQSLWSSLLIKKLSAYSDGMGD